MPSPEDWQKSISRLGFELLLDTDFDVLTFSGFLPCQYNGVQTGFEYYCELEKRIAPQGLSIEFITHSTYQEYIAAAIAAATLTVLSEGELEEPQEGNFYTGEEAVAWAKAVETEAPLVITESIQAALVTATSPPTKPWWRFW